MVQRRNVDKYKTILIIGLVSGIFLLGFLCWVLYQKTKKLNSVADISKKIIENIKNADENYKRRNFLDDNLPDVYEKLKQIIKKDSGITAVFFDREKSQVISKLVGTDRTEGFYNSEAEKQDIEERSIYLPFFEGKDTIYEEHNFKSNFKQHNPNITAEYLLEKNVTTESIICVPIILDKHRKPFGIVSFQSDKKNFFNKKDRKQVVKTIADMLAISIFYYRAKSEHDKAKAEHKTAKAEREKAENERIIIKKDRDKIIGIVTHRFRNFFEVKNSTLQSIQLNLEKWDKEILKQRLLGLGGDFQITKSLFDSFILWIEIIGKKSINMDKSDFKLCEILKTEVSQLNLALKENKIECKTNCEGEIMMKNLPKIYVKEIIGNLLINCIQHFINNDIEKPEILIDVKEDKEYVQLNVIDNGLGIPLVIQHNMFKVGFNATYNRDKISGFGNKIIKGIIDEINGKVDIVYSNEQKGTKIQISIPYKHIK